MGGVQILGIESMVIHEEVYFGGLVDAAFRRLPQNIFCRIDAAPRAFNDREGV
jgi:hypothetical protein